MKKIVIKIVFMEQMAHVADPSTLNLPENRMIANNNDLERRKSRKTTKKVYLSVRPLQNQNKISATMAAESADDA